MPNSEPGPSRASPAPSGSGVDSLPAPSLGMTYSSAPSRASSISPKQSQSQSQSQSHFASPSQQPSPSGSQIIVRRVGGKANVSSACGPCKRAHLACDVARPCKRCVNMGKEEQCEDVPHKKRGRPKVIKPSLGTPFARARLSTEPGFASGRWRQQPPHPYAQPYQHPHGPYGQPYMPPPPPDPMTAVPIYRPEDDPYAPPTIFTAFTSTDFKVLRVSSTTAQLTGYHPHEFTNLNLLDWVHVSDRHLIEVERSRLVQNPFGSGTLITDRDTQVGILQRSERDLLTPAEGMRDPYPNQNVRIVRTDQQFSMFNVRLHLGGGLGASLWQPETLNRIYLVISFLLIPPPRRDYPPPPLPLGDPRRMSVASYGPPTPLTPIIAHPMGATAPPAVITPTSLSSSTPTTATFGPHPGQPIHPSSTPTTSMGAPNTLPSFSAIAAAADAPPVKYEQVKYEPVHAQTAYYPVHGNGNGNGNGNPHAPPGQYHPHPHTNGNGHARGSHQTSPVPDMYAYPRAPPATAPYGLRTPSPSEHATGPPSIDLPTTTTSMGGQGGPGGPDIGAHPSSDDAVPVPAQDNQLAQHAQGQSQGQSDPYAQPYPDYPPPLQAHPTPDQQGGYYDERYDYRRESEWHARDPVSMMPTSSPAEVGHQGQDYGKRAWEL